MSLLYHAVVHTTSLYITLAYHGSSSFYSTLIYNGSTSLH